MQSSSIRPDPGRRGSAVGDVVDEDVRRRPRGSPARCPAGRGPAEDGRVAVRRVGRRCQAQVGRSEAQPRRRADAAQPNGSWRQRCAWRRDREPPVCHAGSVHELTVDPGRERPCPDERRRGCRRLPTLAASNQPRWTSPRPPLLSGASVRAPADVGSAATGSVLMIDPPGSGDGAPANRSNARRRASMAWSTVEPLRAAATA